MDAYDFESSSFQDDRGKRYGDQDFENLENPGKKVKATEEIIFLDESCKYFNEKGQARAVVDQELIVLGLEFFKQDPHTPIEITKLLRIHNQMRSAYASYHQITFPDKGFHPFEVIDFVLKILVATSKRISWNAAEIFPHPQIEEWIKFWMESGTEWKGFVFDDLNFGIFSFDVQSHVYGGEEDENNLLAPDKEMPPGNRYYASLLASVDDQLELNRRTADRVSKLLETGNREDLLKAASYAKQSCIPIGSRDDVKAPRYEEDSLSFEFRKLKREWDLQEVPLGAIKIKGIKVNGHRECGKVKTFLERPKASDSSFKDHGYPFVEKHRVFTKFNCDKETDVKHVSVHQPSVRELFYPESESVRIESERNFELSATDKIVMHMVGIFWDKVRRNGISNTEKDRKRFADHFFNDRGRKKFFGAAGNLYLQYTKLAVAYTSDNGSTKYMPYALFYRYMDDLLRKSVDVHDGVLRCLNGCSPTTATGTVTIKSLSNHLEPRITLCFVCVICFEKFAHSENFDQHVTLEHVKKNEYQHIVDPAKKKFLDVVGKGLNEVGELSLDQPIGTKKLQFQFFVHCTLLLRRVRNDLNHY